MDVLNENFMPALRGRLLHAYTVSGGTAEDSLALAKHVALRAVCERGGAEPCGTCAHCRKVIAGIHPDVVIAEKKADKKEYQAEDIRALRADACVIPNEAERKVYIITEADKLSAVCQNILLKTLEEPPAYAVFILIAENASVLLPTVRSRCIELKVPPRRDGNEASEETKNTAAAIMDAICSRNRLRLTETLFSLESIQKNELGELADEMRRLAVAGLRGGSALTRDELLHVAGVFDEVRKYLVYNLSAGHIVGLLLAELL